MKIVHIAPNAPYNDNWGYQENLLPKYQKKLGHDVIVITTNTMHQDGKIVEVDCADYMLEDGVRVIRLKKKKYLHNVLTNICSKLEIFDLLADLKPDFVFFHGVVSTTIFDVIKYKKRCNPRCIIVQDNHQDYYNGLNPNGVKGKVLRSYHRTVNKRSVPFVEKVYGVTPWRKQYAEDYFGIPEEKTGVLIMGADDEKIDFENKDNIRQNIRQQYGVKDEDFLVVTGGKIDSPKNVVELMEACSCMGEVKLIVFGNVAEDLQEHFDELLKNSNNIIYIGWLSADKVYDYFMASELVCFPGTHSVMWEQACACKVPCLFKKWEGMEHVNNGGNSSFVERVTVDSLRSAVIELKYTEKYKKMRNIAESEATDVFLYSGIAKKSLETCEQEHVI